MRVPDTDLFGHHAADHDTPQESREQYLAQNTLAERAMDNRTYLIDGRRGSGKTQLARTLPSSLGTRHSVELSQEELLAGVMSKISQALRAEGDASEATRCRVWETILWGCVLHALGGGDAPVVRTACQVVGLGHNARTPAEFVEFLVRSSSPDSSQFKELMLILTRQHPNQDRFAKIDKGVQKCLEIINRERLHLSIDTAEEYDIANQDIRDGLSSLIATAAKLNRDYRLGGLSVRLFLHGESFNEVVVPAVKNYSKVVVNRLSLVWRRRDLLRMACYRLHRGLCRRGEHFPGVPADTDQIDWANHEWVKTNIWDRAFEPHVHSSIDRDEDCWVYVLRHTHLQPRQVIRLGNRIVRLAYTRGESFPIRGATIRDAIAQEEFELVNEVYSAYSKVFPGAASIVGALQASGSALAERSGTTNSALIKGSTLHELAPKTAGSWPDRNYSREQFMRLIIEMGIVGRVRTVSSDKIIEADFQHFVPTPMHLNDNDECVFHPVFCRVLGRQMRDFGGIVLPFPGHEDS